MLSATTCAGTSATMKAHRRRPQHPAHDHDHRIGDRLEEFHQRRAARQRQPGQGETEEQREHHQRQHGALCRRRDRVAGHNRHQRIDPAHRRCVCRRQHGDVTECRRERRIMRKQGEHERCRQCGEQGSQGQQHDEHHDRPPRDAARCRRVAGGVHTDHDQGQHQRHHRHLQPVQPQLADRLRHVGNIQRCCRTPGRQQQTDHGAAGQPGQHATGGVHREGPGTAIAGSCQSARSFR